MKSDEDHFREGRRSGGLDLSTPSFEESGRQQVSVYRSSLRDAIVGRTNARLG